MEANKGKFYYWLIAISIWLYGYWQLLLPVPPEIPPTYAAIAFAGPSFQQNHSVKFVAEAAPFEGIHVSGRSSNAEDKSKPQVKFVAPYPGFDALAQLASVYIHRLLTQAYFSKFLYLLYCVLII